MELSGIAGFVLPVTNPAASRTFYEALGFRAGRSGAGFATVYFNWFWLEFVVGEAVPSTAAIALRVENLDSVAAELSARGLSDHVIGECGPTGSGRKGIRLVDVDGYQLELFTK
jgi:catechol 2,3-dioxygenase-like lactoylglutathione lyase family enzyme